MQESGYKLSAVNKKSNDFGISQINHRNIASMGLDKQRLVADLDYSVDTGAYILSNFRRYESREPGHWWVRYNCGNVKVLGEKCKNYKKKVVRYL